MGLAQRLRDESRILHREAEVSPFVEAWMNGELAPGAYLDFLTSLLPVYDALESALAAAALPPPLSDPRLFRSARIVADLPVWEARARRPGRSVPVAHAYAESIRIAASQIPGALAGHAYVRHLGDLSGGQLMRRPTARILGVDSSHESPGLAFFHFPEIPQPGAFKEAYRAALDSLPEALHDGVVGAALQDFRWNVAMFTALAGSQADDPS